MRRNPLALSCLLACALAAAGSARGADYSFKAAASVQEEFNDNLYETAQGRRGDLVTHLTPSLSLAYGTPLWAWKLGYTPEYRHYARGTVGDELLQNVSAVGDVRVIDNLLFLNVSDTHSRVSIDGNREHPYSNRTDENVLTVSPYLEYRLDPRWSAKVGYRFVARSYGRGGGTDNREQAVFLKVTRETTPKSNVFMTADGARVYGFGSAPYERLTHAVGAQYRYAAGSSLTALGGYALEFSPAAPARLAPYWELRLTHDLAPYTVELKSGVSYDSDPGVSASERRYLTGRLARGYGRGVLGVSGSYSHSKSTLNPGSTAVSWFSFGGDATLELSRSCSAHVQLATDRYTDRAGDPYRNSFSAGLRQALNYELSLGVDYTRIAYGATPFTPVGSPEANRVTVSLNKNF